MNNVATITLHVDPRSPALLLIRKMHRRLKPRALKSLSPEARQRVVELFESARDGNDLVTAHTDLLTADALEQRVRFEPTGLLRELAAALFAGNRNVDIQGLCHAGAPS